MLESSPSLLTPHKWVVSPPVLRETDVMGRQLSIWPELGSALLTVFCMTEVANVVKTFLAGCQKVLKATEMMVMIALLFNSVQKSAVPLLAISNN